MQDCAWGAGGMEIALTGRIVMAYLPMLTNILTDTLLTATRTPALSKLTLRELSLLMTLTSTQEGWGVRELYRTMGIPKPSVTRSVDRLVKLGLAQRALVEGDGRLRSITVTDLGRNEAHKLASNILAQAA